MSKLEARDRSLDKYRRLLLNPENRDVAKQEIIDDEITPYGCTPSVPAWLLPVAKAWQKASMALEDAEQDVELGFNDAELAIQRREHRVAEFGAACGTLDEGLELWLNQLAAEARAIPEEDLSEQASAYYVDGNIDEDDSPDWLDEERARLDRLWR